MATPSSIPAWRIPWPAGPGRLQSMGSQGVRRDRATNNNSTHTHTCTDTHIPPTHVCVALNHDSASFSEDTLPPLGRGQPCHMKSNDFPGGGGGFCRISMVFPPLEIFF